MAPKVAIIIYSLYHHIAQLAEEEKKGIEAAGGVADIYQVPETLSDDVLKLLHAPAKPNYPIATNDTLTGYDAYLFGIPTRFGNYPAQFKAFWDATGGLWAQGALAGKQAGIFVSTSGQGGGQETTAVNALSVLVHHGIIFVPLRFSHYKPTWKKSTVVLHTVPVLLLVLMVLDNQPNWKKKLLSSKVNLSTKLFPNKLVFLDEYRVYLIL